MSQFVWLFAFNKDSVQSSPQTSEVQTPVQGNKPGEVEQDRANPTLSRSERQRKVYSQMLALGEQPVNIHHLSVDDRLREHMAFHKSIPLLDRETRKDRFYLASLKRPTRKAWNSPGVDDLIAHPERATAELRASGYHLTQLPKMLSSYVVGGKRWHSALGHSNKNIVAAMDGMHVHTIPQLLPSMQSFLRTQCKFMVVPKQAVHTNHLLQLSQPAGALLMKQLQRSVIFEAPHPYISTTHCEFVHQGRYHQVWDCHEIVGMHHEHDLFDHSSAVTLTHPIMISYNPSEYVEGTMDDNYSEGTVRGIILNILAALEPGSAAPEHQRQQALTLYSVLHELSMASKLSNMSSVQEQVAQNIQCGIAAYMDEISRRLHVVPFIVRDLCLFSGFNIFMEESLHMQACIDDRRHACTPARNQAKQIALNASVLLYFIDIMRTILALHQEHVYPMSIMDLLLIGFDDDCIPYSGPLPSATAPPTHARLASLLHTIVLPRDEQGHVNDSVIKSMKQSIFQTHPQFDADMATYLRGVPYIDFHEENISSLTLSQCCLVYVLMGWFASIQFEEEGISPVSMILKTSPEEFWGAVLRGVLENRLEEVCLEWIPPLLEAVRSIPNPDQSAGSFTRLFHLQQYLKEVDWDMVDQHDHTEPSETKGNE